MLNNFYYRITGPEDAQRRWVFLHGLMGYSSNWRKITSQIDETDQVLVYDQRGHGKSFKPESGYSPEDYASDLKEILDDLGWERIVLVGHSMGGRNALNFAYRYPERVSHLIIEDIGPESNSSTQKYRDLFELIPTPFPNKREAKDFFLNEFPKRTQGRWQNPMVLGQYLYSNLIQTDSGQADWRFNKDGILASVEGGRAQSRWHEIESLKMPTLWIRGEKTDELSKEDFDKLCQMNPVIQGVEIANAGHWVHSEQPEAFTEHIWRFVEQSSDF